MKESLERIKAWAKAHPYLAGAIVLGVVVLAYLAIKSRGSGGGGGSGGYDLGEPEPGPDAGADTGLPLGLGGSGDTGQTTSGFSPVEPVTSVPVAGNNGFGTYEPVQPVTPSSVYTSAPDTYPIAGGASLSSPQMSFMVSDQTGQPKGTAPIPEGGGKVPLKQQTAQINHVKARVTQTYKTVVPPKDTDNARKLSALNAPSEQKKDRPKDAPGTTQTPAQRVGKSRYFTGYWNGIWYVLGYPRTLSAAGTIGTNTGAKKPTQTGGGKKKGR